MIRSFITAFEDLINNIRELRKSGTTKQGSGLFEYKEQQTLRIIRIIYFFFGLYFGGVQIAHGFLIHHFVEVS